MSTFREIVDEVMKRAPSMERIAPADLPYVTADCMQAIADEMDRRYPPQPSATDDKPAARPFQGW